jgi:hypothetical protein
MKERTDERKRYNYNRMNLDFRLVMGRIAGGWYVGERNGTIRGTKIEA